MEDNGSGISSDLDLSESSSIGLKLVNALVRQIKGKLTLEQGQKGARWVIDF